jgi:release factor glutamine methyltransferase
MLTVLESIQLSTEYLEKKGIESPRTNAELLLADILGCKRLDLYLKFDRPVSEEEKVKYREYISRRGKFEPLQYILGFVEFYGLKFFVDKNVLIPRQETETLIDTILNQNKEEKGLRILDIGTGTGNLPVCLAKHLADSTITTIDVSDKALNIAKKNIELHNLTDRINLEKIDILKETIIAGNQYDIVVSNPPYVDEVQYNTLQKEITEFEPKSAVTDFSDGFSFYNRISEIHDSLLQQSGKVYFEIGAGQSEQVQNIMKNNNLDNVQVIKDYLDIDRVIYGVKK